MYSEAHFHSVKLCDYEKIFIGFFRRRIPEKKSQIDYAHDFSAQFNQAFNTGMSLRKMSGVARN